MSITVNNGGSLHELSDISVNVGGTLYSLDRITANEGGVLREIFTKSALSELPTSLTWSVDKTISGYDTNSKINSVSDDGLAIIYTSKSPNAGKACICSNTFSLPAGAVISIAPLSIAGNGTTVDLMYLYLFNSNGEEISAFNTNANALNTAVITVESAGEYHIRLGGYSLTGGQTTSYYTSTVSAEISFSM